MDWELWGTFSVGDHLRRRAYVADVLLYDRLVIPTPPDKDDKEQKRWRKMGWRPERQRHLLDLIGKNYVVKVPWTEQHRLNWETRYNNALIEQRADGERVAVRSQMAEAAAADLSHVLTAREDFKNRGGKPEEVDQLAHFTTRDFLIDWSNQQNDTQLFLGLPPVKVDPVVAYGSYSAFCRDHQVESGANEQEQPGNLLNLFGIEFLVPNDSNRSDEDLLKQAVDLASLEETKQHRQMFHRWRREKILANKTPKEVKDEMDEVIERYRAAVHNSKIATVAKYAFAIVTAGLGAAAVVNPILGIPGAFTGLGSFAASEYTQKGMPAQLKVAAMFYDARKRFGWYRWMRRK